MSTAIVNNVQCAPGVIKLFDNKVDLYLSTGPHPYKHGFEIFNAKLIKIELPKNYTRFEFNPTKIASDLSSLYSSGDTNRVEKKLEEAKRTKTAFEEAFDELVTLVQMDFRAYVSAPKETERVREYYLENPSLLKDSAEDIIAELKRFVPSKRDQHPALSICVTSPEQL